MNSRPGKILIHTLMVIALACAWWLGKTKAAPDYLPYVRAIFPQATRFEQEGDIYSVFLEEAGRTHLLGWAASGVGQGYGGPLAAVVGIDTAGGFVGAGIAGHGETPVFFSMVKTGALFQALAGKSFDSTTDIDTDIAGFTGASRSFAAVVAGIEDAAGKVARDRFGISVPAPGHPLEFGILELTVILLFAAGIFIAGRKQGSRELPAWLSRLAGLLVIGFWKDSPLTIAKISSFLLGYFAEPKVNLYWYLLLGGFVLAILVAGKNIHCLYVCPFGTLQRLIGVVGGAGRNIPGWLARWTEVLRNLTVLAVVFLVFLTEKPGSASYEPFGVIFELKGTTLQWLLLFIVLSASLMIKTPWCRFFCPMQTCASVIRAFRKREVGRGKEIAGMNFSRDNIIPIIFILSAFALIAGILIQGFS